MRLTVPWFFSPRIPEFVSREKREDPLCEKFDLTHITRKISRLLLVDTMVFGGVASLIALAGVVSGSDALMSWPDYKAHFGKVYASTSAEAEALQNFEVNSAKIAAHNALDLPFKQGLNKFSDGSRAAWRKRFSHNMSRPSVMLSAGLGREGTDCVSSQAVPNAEVAALPSVVNWVAAGNRVSPVGDQGNCGDCWAWATVATIEGSLDMGGHSLVALSPQDISSCTGGQGNSGCNGGNDYLALPWIGIYGIDTLAHQPFLDGKTGATSPCNQSRHGAVNITGCHQIYNNLNTLQTAVATQPVSGSIEVVDDLMEYTGGIYTGKGDGPGTEGPCQNDTTANVNHAVTFVGYGTTPEGIDYWLMKNSWGRDWGENGFFRILRGSNTCGVETYGTTADGAFPISRG